MTVYVVSYRDRIPEGALAVNTTSRSTSSVSRQLSPFTLGPCTLYEGLTATNVENAWQFSKCYPQHVGGDGSPTQEYFAWAKAGWANPRAERYPMGKGAQPAYSWWAGEKLPYVPARRRIYVPLYTKAVVQTQAYHRLEQARDQSGRDIYLIDFDGYNHKSLGMSHGDALTTPNRRMGHAFVLAMLLDGYLNPETGLPYVEPPEPTPEPSCLDLFDQLTQDEA